MSTTDHQALFYSSSIESVDVWRSFASLDKWEEICSGHNSEKRQADRHKYRTSVVLSTVTEQLCEEASETVELFIMVRARNISKTGISILASMSLLPSEGFTDRTPIIKIKDVFEVGDRGSCGLLQPSATLDWMEVETVRVRPVVNDLIEIGMRFIGRRDPATVPEHDFVQRILRRMI